MWRKEAEEFGEPNKKEEFIWLLEKNDGGWSELASAIAPNSMDVFKKFGIDWGLESYSSSPLEDMLPLLPDSILALRKTKPARNLQQRDRDNNRDSRNS